MKLEAEDVARYLKDHPEFFEEHANLLTDITIPHPHGGRTISLAERQLLALRDKNTLLESKLRELIQFGEENDTLGERVHRFGLALLTATSLESCLQAIYYNLREDFAVPHVTLRLWDGNEPPADLPELSATSKELRVYAESLTNPSCGPHALYETGSWFGEDNGRLKSFAMVALRSEHAFGLLVLASEDPQRFYQGMGTLYLKRIGELVSVALKRFLSSEAASA
jgi:uncharacterized protein YigA (DUF484 family)